MYFIYVTTNNVNNKKYVGLCSMKKPNWKSYLGSGKILKRAISKYGTENFTREIIEYHDNIEDAIAAEKNFILQNECHLKEDWYNIAVGFTTQGSKGKKQTEKHRLAMQKLLCGVPRSEESKSKQSETRKQRHANGMYSYPVKSKDEIERARELGKKNAKPKELREYTCMQCGVVKEKMEYCHHEPKQKYRCNQCLPGRPPISVIVYGIKYRSEKDAANSLGLSLDQIRYRLSSDKYPEFIKLNIKEEID